MSNGKKVRDLEIAKLPFALKTLRRLPIPHKLGLLERLYGSALGKLGVVWVSCSNSVVWKLDLSDPCHRWIVYGDYEGMVGITWLKNWLSKGGTVVDSGANIGQILLYLAPLPSVTVHAFEPLPEAREWLEECLSLQESWEVCVSSLGLSSHQQLVEFQCDGARSTLNLNWYSAKDLQRVTIEVDGLDNYFESRKIDSVRLWKLDVEDGEYEALLGATKALRRKMVDAIYFECSPETYFSILDLLTDFTYEIYQLNSDGRLQKAVPPMSTTNLIALPRKAELTGNMI